MKKINRCTSEGYCSAPFSKSIDCKYFELKSKTKYKCIYQYRFNQRCSNIMALFYAKFNDIKEYVKRYNINIEDIEINE